MSQIITSEYLGSSSLQTSEANQELVPSINPNWTHKLSLRKFSFSNSQDCNVIVNGKSNLYLRANQGFQIGFNDAPIYSFVVVQGGISYNWIGSY